jgi:RNA polymerase subunit RPABC4/transcription elongation factor Spt4
MKTRYCPECGRSIPLDARACPYCAKTIPMHDGQIVTKTDDDKSKIVLIIVVVVFILIFSTIAIAATVYVYVSGLMGSQSSWESTPTIPFSQQDLSAYNSLNVIYSDPSDIDWSELKLQVDGTTADHGMSGTVTVADGINITSIAGTGAYIITIIYIPTNTLLGMWDFTAAT